MLEFQTDDIQIDIHDETFRINDTSLLDWAFQKLASIKAKDADVKQRADAHYEKIKKWEDAERGKLKDEISYFEHLIQDYHQRVLMQDPKSKTLSSPYGKSKSRRSKATPEQADKEALLGHILINNMQDYIKKDVKWGDFKKNLSVAEVNGVATVFDENGEKVPGVIVKPESVSFTVEVE